MKKLLLLLFIPLVSFSQGEQLYADGSDVDQDGNIFEWISYGEQDWSIENAEMVTYRDGTEIPQVTDASEWQNLTTGAWCYNHNDPTKGKLYNWYAVMGIHDNDENTPNKEFAPEGWHVPTHTEWTTLENYLIASGYNYDQTTTENKIGKAMASTSGWISSNNTGAIGNDQSLNNSSGFNALQGGYRFHDGSFDFEGYAAQFWSSTVSGTGALSRNLHSFNSHIQIQSLIKVYGFSMRFVRDAQTASLDDNSIYNFKIFPNPSSDFIHITGVEKELELIITDVSGKKVMSEYVKNKIDISTLEKGTYILNLSDGLNTSTHKIIKE